MHIKNIYSAVFPATHSGNMARLPKYSIIINSYTRQRTFLGFHISFALLRGFPRVDSPHKIPLHLNYTISAGKGGTSKKKYITNIVNQ